MNSLANAISFVIPACILLASCTNTGQTSGHQAIKEEAVAELRKVLSEEEEWVKVHAAEFLLWAGYPEGVAEAFEKEAELHQEKSPYRIGIWRVLAQVPSEKERQTVYINKVIESFLDTSSTDRIHAAETLAKLGISPVTRGETITKQALESPVRPLAIYTLWSVAYTSPDSMASSRKALLQLIQAQEAAERSTAAYSLRKLKEIPKDSWKTLAETAISDSSSAAVYLLSTAFVTAPEEPESSILRDKVRTSLLRHAEAPGKGDRMEMAMALSEKGTEDDMPLLLSLLRTESPLEKARDNADVRASAAFALLKIIEKEF